MKGKLWQVGRSPVWLAALLLLAWGVASMLWGERLPRKDGFGWDGLLYRYLAEFPGRPCDWASTYGGRRCLPSFTVHAVMRGLGLPLDGPHILNTFAAVNVALFLATLLALEGCCRELNLGRAARWLLLCGYFVNYAHLKLYHYCACQTDVWATALSAFLFLAYLRRWAAGVLLVIVAGAFVWPPLPQMGAILFLFPRPAPAAASTSSPAPAPARLHLVVAGLLALAAVVADLYWVGLQRDRGQQPDQMIRRLLPLSAALLGVYIFAVLAPLLNIRRLFVWQFPGRGFGTRLVVLGMAFVPVWLARKWIDPLFTGPEMWITPLSLLKALLIGAVSKPLIFVVAHFAWFGPVVAVAALWWKDVCREAHRLGVGLVLALLLCLVLALGAESRQWLTAFPALACLTAVVADRRGWGTARVLGFAGLALLASRIWFPLTVAPWPEADLVYDYPMQRFFMTVGYMTTRSYLLLGSAGLATLGTAAALAFVPARRAAGAVRPDEAGVPARRVA
jgi:hypothetical protein